MSEQIQAGKLPVLRADQLCYARQNRQLINKVSLAIAAGQITMLAGHNGAGKEPVPAAAARAGAAGFRTSYPARPASSKKWSFKNLSCCAAQPARHLAFLAPQLDQDGLDACLAQAGLFDRQHVPTRQLSGGEAQKLALTGALATSPKLLFLDEPTASLDYESTRFVEDSLQQARASGMAILMVSHNRTQIKRLADRVLFLARGTITG